VIVALNKGSSPASVSGLGTGLVDQLTGAPFSGSVPARGGVVLVANS
jgi:hypothetical protein